MLVIQEYWLTTVFLFTKRSPFEFLARSIALCFYKLEAGVGQWVHVDMLFLACVPGDLLGESPLCTEGSVSLKAPPTKTVSSNKIIFAPWSRCGQDVVTS